MALNKKPYKGCRDFFPADMRVRNYLFEAMKNSAETFAYEPYDGPLLEEVELYKAKSGEELINDQIYGFTDRGGREVAIRPEMTPTIARMVANIHKQYAKPIRWYSIPNLMRYEKPQRGRVREHWQYNVDIFGAKENLGELEVLNLVVHFLTGLGATSEMFSIQVNDRRIVDAVFQTVLKLDDEKSLKLYKIIDKAKKVTTEALDKMLIEILDQDQINKFKEYLAVNTTDKLAGFILANDIQASGENLAYLLNLAKKTGLESYIEFDPTIVRGLDYYTGLVFEVFDKHPENKRAIAGGGAYANLLGIFNEPALAGIGFGLGDVTLRDFLTTHKILPDLTKPENDFFLTYSDDAQEAVAFSVAASLRALGLKVELNLGKMKFSKVFKTAENKNHFHVGIIEEKDGEIQVQVKNLESRTGDYFKPSDIEAIKNFIK
jgi:histidyl-tRNA synthetase